MDEIFKKGAAYFAVVFTVAFALGTVRTVFVTPVTGPLLAVLLELPVIVATSWVVAQRVFKDVPYDASRRRMAGCVAFALLMASECTLAVVLFSRSALDWASELLTPLGLLGLSGQLVFAAMPLLVRRSAP